MIGGVGPDDARLDDAAKIRDLLGAWTRAVRERNLAAILANHDPNILMFDVPTVLLTGIDNYAASWQYMFPWLGPKGQFELSDLRVTAGADVAFASGILRCAGLELQEVGKALTIRLTVGLVKRDGGWVVTHEHHSEAVGEETDSERLPGA
jgi:uncharacterized protein (TIGR02246 family)